MGATHYSFPIDIWSLGCGTDPMHFSHSAVITEVLIGHPLFVSLDSDGEQLVSIINSRLSTLCSI